MATNWNLLQVPDIGQAFKAGYDQRRQQNAFTAYAQNPGDPGNLNALAEFNPGFVVQQKQQQQNYALEQSKIQQKSHAEQMQVLGRLVSGVQDETSYQRALAAARQVGIDVSSAPPSYTPEYVAQTRMLVDAYNKDGGQQLTSTMKELVALGYQPGTPEFQQALAQTINAGYSKPYTDIRGATRLYTPNITVPAQGPTRQAPQQPAQALTYDQFKAYADIQGVSKAAQWAAQNGLVVAVRTPQEAESLPSGTRIALPDGTEGVVP